MTEGEKNVPETAKLDVGGPVIEVERVEIFDEDGTELTVVKDVDRSVVEVDLYDASAETKEPHEGCEPPGEPRTIALSTVKPRLVSIRKFLG